MNTQLVAAPAAQSTAAIFTEIEVRDGDAPAQLLPQPPLLSAGSGSASAAMAGGGGGPSSSLHRALSGGANSGAYNAASGLSRSNSEAIGVQVVPWRTPTASPRASLVQQVRRVNRRRMNLISLCMSSAVAKGDSLLP